MVVSFLASGQGSNFLVVAKKIRSGYIKAEAGILISDNDAPALRKAENIGIKAFRVNPKDYESKTDFENEMASLLKRCKTDLIVTAGYMRILSPHFVRTFKNKIINIHPSLLPAFSGRDAVKQAIEHGAKITGCTTHFIDEGIDTGPIIMQAAVPILPGDDASILAKKILAKEHRILPESIKLFCEDRLTINGRTVIIN